jgi:hypothetical protein
VKRVSERVHSLISYHCFLYVTLLSTKGDKGQPKYHYSRAGSVNFINGRGFVTKRNRFLLIFCCFAIIGLIDDLKEYKLVKPRSVDLSTMSINADEHPAGLKAFEVSAFGRHFRVLLQPNGKSTNTVTPMMIQ